MISNTGEACNSSMPSMFEYEFASAGNGEILFELAGQTFPCSLDVDVDAYFDGELSGIPATDQLVANDITVDDCEG